MSSELHELIERDEAETLERVREFLRLPSFSDSGEGMADAARWTHGLVAELCEKTETVETGGYPVIFGRRSSPGARHTLLLYGLYDVTPTLAEEWSVDPLAADIVPAAALGRPAYLGPLLVGRGANNHKGPVVAALRALTAQWRATGSLPVNLLVVIEGEEEIGSPHLPRFIEAHAEELMTADAMWLPCMQQSSTGAMTLREAFKGCAWVDVSCRGGEWGGPADGRHVWAGNSAWLDAPMMQLVRALATLYDDDQRVTIDGLDAFRREVDAEFGDRASALAADWAANPAWGERTLAALGARQALSGKPFADHLAHYMTGVTMNIQGIAGGYQGPSFYSMLPGSAIAHVDFRFPPGLEPARFVELLRTHLDRRGFPQVEVALKGGYPGAPALEGPDPLIDAARAVAGRAGVSTSIWPLANNCCPAALFATLGRHIPFSIAGFGHGDGAHAPDEYITVDSVGRLMHFTVDFVDEVARALAAAERVR